MEHITDLNELSNEVTLVDFYATWCPPCRMLSPVLEKVDIVKVVKVDVDKAPLLADAFNIRAVPTLILFKDRKPLARKEGYMGLNDLLNWIKAQNRQR